MENNKGSEEARKENRNTGLWPGLGILLLLVGLSYSFTLRPGHRAGDFALFMQHTINLVEGQPYARTGFVRNPETPTLGPAAYPPGTSVLLAPVYTLWGLNFTALKGVMILCFLAALWLLALLARPRLEPAWVLALVVLVGFQPYFWDIKDNVVSDLPFLAWTYLCLVLVRRMTRKPEQIGLGIGIGFCLFAAVMTRTVGVTLVFGLLVWDLVYHRRLWPGRLFWIPAGVWIGLMTMQTLLFPIDSGGGYLDILVASLTSPGVLVQGMIDNAKYYILACTINILLDNGYWALLKFGLAGVTFLFAAFGYLWRCRHDRSMMEVFVAVYLGVMLIWPGRMPSYLIPIYSLFFFYVLVGFQQVLQGFSPVLRRGFALGGLALMLGTYVGRYSTLEFRELDQNVASEEARALYQFMRDHTPEEAVFICRVPRTIALFTDRLSSSPLFPEGDRDRYTAGEEQANFRYFEEMKARYVVTGPRGRLYHREVLPLWHLVQDRPDRFEPLFENEAFALYQIR